MAQSDIPTSRKVAKAQGSTVYIGGYCTLSHPDQLRYTSDASCVACTAMTRRHRRATMGKEEQETRAQWRRLNPDKVKAQNARAYARRKAAAAMPSFSIIDVLFRDD